MPAYTIDDFARMIDHTNLKAFAAAKDMTQLCNEAQKYHFKMVAVNQVQSKLCAQQLAGTDIDVGAAISFPLGQTSIASKAFDTQDAIQNGANEIDYVVNLTEVKNGNYAYVKEEMTRLVALCHQQQVPCKVIFENCYLTKAEIKKLAEIAREVKPDFIKTSTGFGTRGAQLEDVALMKSVVGNEVKVKAAGGIRNTDDFLNFIKAGADRIGTSAGVQIIEALKERMRLDQVSEIEVDRPYPKITQ
ncbi:deoxyribose-phosphate aldolase [Pediococcus siamensis]|uniref:deoxyribose-phosphate aldolase n=1 Tax=Pediococcus siamensis TaxID=381829 RepID=UPI00399FB41A